MVKEKAYAKINLMLKVVRKTENNMHELETIMAPISDLYDELTFEKNNSMEFEIEGFDCDDNSILKAAKLFQKEYKTSGAKITVKKNIPLDAGLAGGSSDSSATLRGLNKLFGLNRPLNELGSLAKRLGSDNVFCLYNRAALCKGFGNDLEFINDLFSFKCLLIKPNFGLRTSDVFKRWSSNDLHDYNYSDFVNALKENNYETLNNIIFNDLYNPALLLSNDLKLIKNKIEKNNAKAFMTGSGSTLFVLDKDINRLNDIKNQFTDCFSKICKIDSVIIEKNN